jgi:microcystin-dependent protein
MNSLKAAFTDLQNDIAGAGTPIGSVIMWTGDTASIPAGYAVANGALLNTVTYGTLYGIIGTRYGPLIGADFRLPDLTSRLPQGTIGVPTIPATKVTSVSSNVDDHTHTVNSTFTAGNAADHTHSGSVLTAGSTNTSITAPGGANAAIGVNSSFTAGNASAHSHTLFFNSQGANANHAHTNSGQSANHTHTYFKPNTGANNSGNNGNADHTHTVNANTTDHSHAIIGNTGNNDAGVNSSFTAGNAASHTHSGGVLTAGNTNTSITAPGGSNSTIGVNSSFTAGNATTISSPVLTHTHNFAVTELVFIIRVS